MKYIAKQIIESRIKRKSRKVREKKQTNRIGTIHTRIENERAIYLYFPRDFDELAYCAFILVCCSGNMGKVWRRTHVLLMLQICNTYCVDTRDDVFMVQMPPHSNQNENVRSIVRVDTRAA